MVQDRGVFRQRSAMLALAFAIAAGALHLIGASGTPPVNVAPTASPPPLVAPNIRPDCLRASLSPESIDVTWDPPPSRGLDSVTNEERAACSQLGYVLYRWRKGEEDRPTIRYLETGRTSFADDAFEPSATYSYKLRAYWEHERDGNPSETPEIRPCDEVVRHVLDDGPHQGRAVWVTEWSNVATTTTALDTWLAYSSRSSDQATIVVWQFWRGAWWQMAFRVGVGNSIGGMVSPEALVRNRYNAEHLPGTRTYKALRALERAAPDQYRTASIAWTSGYQYVAYGKEPGSAEHVVLRRRNGPSAPWRTRKVVKSRGNTPPGLPDVIPVPAYPYELPAWYEAQVRALDREVTLEVEGPLADVLRRVGEAIGQTFVLEDPDADSVELRVRGDRLRSPLKYLCREAELTLCHGPRGFVVTSHADRYPLPTHAAIREQIARAQEHAARVSDADVREKLSTRRLGIDLDLHWFDCLELIQETTGVSIHRAPYPHVCRDGDPQPLFKCKGLTAEQTLDLVLAPYNHGYFVEHGSVVVDTLEVVAAGRERGRQREALLATRVALDLRGMWPHELPAALADALGVPVHADPVAWSLTTPIAASTAHVTLGELDRVLAAHGLRLYVEPHAVYLVAVQE